MPICKFKKHHKNFVIIDKTGLTDNRLSWKAKGILGYFMTLPDNWKIKLAEVVKHAVDGKVALTSGLNELKKFGYCEMIEKRNQDGSIKEYEYVIYESPEVKLNEKNQLSGFTELDNPIRANVPLIRNELNKELDNTNVLSPAEDFEPKNKTSSKKKKKYTAKFKPESLGGKLAQYMLDEIEKHNPTFPTPDIALWQGVFNKMIYMQGYVYAEIKDIIWYSQNTDFWKPFILNPFALGAKYETLKIQLKQWREKERREQEKEDVFERAKKDFFEKNN